MKFMLTRLFALVVAVLFLAASAHAQDTARKVGMFRAPASAESEQANVKQEAAAKRNRAARRVDPNGVILVGTVTDASSGEPVFDAVVSVGERSATAGREGSYRLERLSPGGASATIERWGYSPQTRNVALVVGTNTLNVTLTSKPVVTLTTISAQVHRLDFESSFFSDVYPFQGLLTVSPIELCTFQGTKSSAEKENFQVITFTGQKTANNNCCASATTGYVANVTLKSGTRLDAIMVNSCTAYNMGFHGRDRATGAFTNFPLSQVTKIEFP